MWLSAQGGSAPQEEGQPHSPFNNGDVQETFGGGGGVEAGRKPKTELWNLVGKQITYSVPSTNMWWPEYCRNSVQPSETGEASTFLWPGQGP